MYAAISPIYLEYPHYTGSALFKFTSIECSVIVSNNNKYKERLNISHWRAGLLLVANPMSVILVNGANVQEQLRYLRKTCWITTFKLNQYLKGELCFLLWYLVRHTLVLRKRKSYTLIIDKTPTRFYSSGASNVNTKCLRMFFNTTPFLSIAPLKRFCHFNKSGFAAFNTCSFSN